MKQVILLHFCLLTCALLLRIYFLYQPVLMYNCFTCNIKQAIAASLGNVFDNISKNTVSALMESFEFLRKKYAED